jgi:predicted N-acetyltransferase YhbS
MSLLRIVPLSAVPATREVVTDWLWQAFGSDNSRDFYASVIDSSLSGADLPLTFVALDDDRPVGTVGESYRGRGLSERLQQTVIDCCLQRGDRHLYLYSACAGYYERFGWRYIGDALDYPATRVRLYHKALG